MSRTVFWPMPIALLFALSCSGDKDPEIIPPDGDADTDADADADADTDTDTDTDILPVGLCSPIPVPGSAFAVSSGSDLAAAIADAAPGSTLALADGTYTVTGPIPIDKPLTLISQSQSRDAVTIDGQRAGGSLLQITSSDVTIAHLTLTGSYDQLIDLIPAAGSIDTITLHDLHLLDPGRYAIYIQRDDDNLRYVDGGELSCSLIDLSNDGRDFIRGACETGGIDGEGVRAFTVRDSYFEGFWCDFATSGPAIRFYRGSRDIVVTRNQVIDAAIGIVMGETRDQIGRTYDDDPCGDTILQSIDGTVTNNIVAAQDDDLAESNNGVTTGIRAQTSCNVTVVHNSVYSVIEPESSIEHQYETTTGVFGNNLMSHAIRRLTSSAAEDVSNLENVPVDTWYYPSDNDFHTAPGASTVINAGSADFLDAIDIDIDGEPRDATPDVGADEVI